MQLVKIVEAIHAKEVVHGDISARNILVKTVEGIAQPAIIDFERSILRHKCPAQPQHAIQFGPEPVHGYLVSAMSIHIFTEP